MMRTKGSYSELIQLGSFDERFDYLRSLIVSSDVGATTFGMDRYLNQAFYGSYEWKKFRREIIIRDSGCDIGCRDREIPKGVMIVIHHIVPITPDDILDRNLELVMDPENAITMNYYTHKILHFGNKENLEPVLPTIRKPNDTIPWR